jgi:hypothetical protein
VVVCPEWTAAVSVLVAVTDHAVERFRQRVGGRSGEVDARPEIIRRVATAWEAGRVSDEPPWGDAARRAARGSVYVRDLVDRSLVFVCRHDPAGREVVVITLWELEGGPAAPRVPRRFTDALERGPRRPRRSGS